MPRFAANCSILFTEVPLLDRFARARDAGFAAVESWWPTGVDLDAFAAAIEAAGQRLVLLNLDAGDMAAGDRGFLNEPDAGARIDANFDAALRLAARLDRPILHALVGNLRAGESREAQLALVYERLRRMAARAADEGVTLSLEAMNAADAPRYLLRTGTDVLAALDAVGAPNLVYQCDFYHLQRTEGRLVETLRAHLDRIGHIQIADAPDRHQPGTGEINYRYVLGALDALGYAGYAALEYRPLGTTEESLAWLPPDRRGEIPASALNL
ncbi:MAG TPA: TIM barrel protein [Thermomicrobiales bacterium]|nr:TIM barrel protein [Thermomicrobiales bacterium]